VRYSCSFLVLFDILRNSLWRGCWRDVFRAFLATGAVAVYMQLERDSVVIFHLPDAAVVDQSGESGAGRNHFSVGKGSARWITCNAARVTCLRCCFGSSSLWILRGKGLRDIGRLGIFSLYNVRSNLRDLIALYHFRRTGTLVQVGGLP
jgi:hypothetical protein